MNRSSRVLQIVIALAFVALVLAIADLLLVFVNVLLLIFAGVLFGIFLNSLMSWLQAKTNLPYPACFALVLLFLLGAMSGAGFFVQARISMQMVELTDQLQTTGQALLEKWRQTAWAKKLLNGEASSGQLLQNAQKMLPAIGTGLNWLLWGLTGIVVIFFLGVYVALEPHHYETGMVKLVPRDQRTRAKEILHTLRVAMTRWIVGRLFSMSVIGVSTAIGLWVLGVPLAAALGIIAALLTFVPNLGPVLSLIPQMLLATQVGADTVLYVVLFNVGLQAMESYVLTPLVERHQVTLPPGLTIAAQLMMGVLLGVMGVMMAAPLTVVALVLVQTVYIRDTLGDHNPGRLAEVE